MHGAFEKCFGLCLQGTSALQMTSMNDAAVAQVLQGPLLGDLAALLRAGWNDGPRVYPFSADLMDDVHTLLVYGDAQPFLRSMLQYFEKKLPGIQARLFSAGDGSHPPAPKDPITFAIAYSLMAMAYVSDPKVLAVAKVFMGSLEFDVPVVLEKLIAKADGMAGYYRTHLPVWDLLQLHLQSIKDKATEAPWAEFVSLTTGLLLRFVAKLQALFGEVYSAEREAWTGAVMRAGMLGAAPVPEEDFVGMAGSRKRRAVSRRDFGSGGGGGSAGAGSGAGTLGGRSRGPHRRRQHRSRSRARAVKVLRGGRGLLRRSRSRARLARRTGVACSLK